MQALHDHRLLPVYELLSDRALIRHDIGPVAISLSENTRIRTAAQGTLEARVFQALSDQELEFLMLKGALMARTVYPAPECRVRTDLDILVRSESVGEVEAQLGRLGYRARHPVASGIPMTQRSFIGELDGIPHGVDVHWDLSQRALLKGLIPFDDLWGRRRFVDDSVGIWPGLSSVDAILHSTMHYFAHYRGQVLVDQWILDIDLTWRALDRDEQSQLFELAQRYGIALLLAAALALSAELFATPIDPTRIEALRERGRSQSASVLLAFPPTGLKDLFLSALHEPRRSDGARLVLRTFIPKAAYMRSKNPGARGWMLPWLYVRRVWEGWR